MPLKTSSCLCCCMIGLVVAFRPSMDRPFTFPKNCDLMSYLIGRESCLFSTTNRRNPVDVSSPYSETSEMETDELISRGYSELGKFFSVILDDWQLHAGGAICSGYNVIVCAPTGAGKTVVGEMALLHAFHKLDQCGIYTTPLKALSNQKYSDLCRIFGRKFCGLSTGDVSINKGAQITVMTTEVYRNIAWRSSTPSATILGTDELTRNAVVVLDEFHYMGHPGRGGVWEESVITSPSHSQIIGLSATLANGKALASWMEYVSGRRTILVDVPGQKRPVPLRYIYAQRNSLSPLFRDPDAGPGSPKGLLGYRGDGEGQKNPKGKSKKKGFDDGDVGDNKTGLPRGLQVNPALRDAAKARLAKVLKTIERRKQRDRGRSVGSYSDFTIPRKLSPGEEKRQTERLLRNEMRREVPSLSFLLTSLKRKSLLPAIFFIFSRAGCDEAARSAYQTMKGPRDPNELLDVELEQFGMNRENRFARKDRKKSRKLENDMEMDEDGRLFRPNAANDPLRSLLDDSFVSLGENVFDESSPLGSQNWEYYAKAGLLDIEEVKQTASRINLFNIQNLEIAFDGEIAEQLMFGIGSHHAGLLPAHKSFVEILFRRQLIKVVFATETLAAGINMPARTTVICSMAKRGGGSGMSLLETSNLLQMAGRAGRRGFDEEGTCVIVATPFETHDDAVKILTDPIKPIKSQFTPSYSLAINLVARGGGKLDVARQLVGKSFASWEHRRAEETTSLAPIEAVNEVVQVSFQEKFMRLLIEALDRRTVNFDVPDLDVILEIMKNRDALKKASKSYASLVKALEQEELTLHFIGQEEPQVDSDDIEESKVSDDMMAQHVSTKRERIENAKRAVRAHIFTVVAELAQKAIEEEKYPSGCLRTALASARGVDPSDHVKPITASELTEFVKSMLIISRKARKFAKENPDVDPGSFLLQAMSTASKFESWESMIAITKTLLSYGCLSADGDILDFENATFGITRAGVNVGMLGFENSLWTLVAIGGAWHIPDEQRVCSGDYSNQALFALEHAGDPSADAEKLIYDLCGMDAAEFAGYVSALVAESSRNEYGPEALEVFRRLTPSQQRVVQTALTSLDQFMEVQLKNSVDPSVRMCNFDISSMNVVTSWAKGSSWSETLALSGLPPGDLVRTLSRVLDAVRQLGNLPNEAMRKGDLLVGGNRVSVGIHPEVRRLCREAAAAIDRYPLKDPFSFDASVGTEANDEFEKDDQVEDDSGEDQ